MGPAPPRAVSSSGGKFVLDDNTETPDTQIAVYDFPTYTLIWEHQILGGVGLGGRPHGLSFSGADGTLILDTKGWEVIPEAKKPLGVFKRTVSPDDPAFDGRPAHIRNFLDCVRSRQQPVENLEVGHFVSTVAHLGNLALRSGAKMVWDAQQERVVDNSKADALVRVAYRPPWSL